MPIGPLEDDLEIISKLENQPKENAEDLKKKFDIAALTIQKFINEKLIGAINTNEQAINNSDNATNVVIEDIMTAIDNLGLAIQANQQAIKDNAQAIEDNKIDYINNELIGNVDAALSDILAFQEAIINGEWEELPDDAMTAHLPISGGAMAGNIDMGGNKISGLPMPTEDNEAATKEYVDQAKGQVLPLTGGAMTGTLTTKGIKLTEGTDYGSTLPTNGVKGQLFFLAE